MYLTKNFLTDPNFFVLAYLHIKSRPDNMRSVIYKEIINSTYKNWFIYTASKIRTNRHKFKPAKVIHILKTNNDKTKLLIVESHRDKIIQTVISIIIAQIYEHTNNVFIRCQMVLDQGSLHTQYSKK